MSTNKHAIIRYRALDKCFRNPGRRYYIENLIEACNKSIYEFAGSDMGIQKRQIFEDIKFMESEQGWSIELNRIRDGRKVYYKYNDTSFSINNSLLNESEENQLKEVLSTLSRFKGMPQFEWIEEMVIHLESSFSLNEESEKLIEFEQNQYLKGLEYFSDFFNAIIYRKTLSITYQGFKQSKSVNILFHPYYLKQYNNRWFVFGRADQRDTITNIAIDRIQSLKESQKKFAPNNLANFDEFFEDTIGVTIPVNAMPERIIIKISKELWPYIESKPLHGSQKIKKITAEYALIELMLLINYELIAALFSLGEGITILEPVALSNAVKTKAKALLNNYL